MSAFISKFLPGRNVPKTKLELITEAWNNIQKYYETAADPLKDAVDLTPIPQSLDNIIKLIQAEEIEFERETGSLETGPCLEYLLQKRVLEELVEFAKVDTPYGMRIHCLRFFCSLVTNVHAQLLPERAVHVPLQKLINSSHRLICRHYEDLAATADNSNKSAFETCSEERIAAISELTLELVKLMHGIFSHFKGANAALMDLFFERGWCRSRGESVWRCSKEGKLFHKRKESVEEKIAWDMFLMPRFDMFQYLIDFMNMPGETGEIARESILFALRLLEDDPEYVCYIVEYSNLCEVMAERLAFYFAHLPKNKGAFSVSSNNRINMTRPSRRQIRFSIPAMVTNNSLLITVNAQSSFKKKRRKRTPFDVNFLRTLETTIDKDRIIDEFFSFWEYLNDVARVAEKRLMTALMVQLTTSFWHPVICTALSSPSAEVSTSATAYTTEMIRSLTDQRLLHVFLIVLLGEDSGVGKDLEPEIETYIPIRDLIDDDKEEEEDDDEDTSTTHTTRASENEDKAGDNEKSLLEKKQREAAEDEELTLRLLLINRIDTENYDLALATLRLFDTIIETYNQFAVYNLVLRNYLDITPDGDYVVEDENRDNIDTSSFESRTIDEDANVTTTATNNAAPEEASKVDELAIAEKSNVSNSSNNKVDDKKEKVRWLVERVISLLPLEDELERMKTPPLSSIISADSFVSGADGSEEKPGQNKSGSSNPYSVVPGNSYDDYFHEAQERFHYALLARNFWQIPYPPKKTKQDYEQEVEDRKGRPARPTSIAAAEISHSAESSHHKSADQASITSSATTNTSNRRTFETYEGLFLSRLFDQFQRMLELPMEQNLLITSILQKVAGVVDKRMDGMLCDWRAVRVGNDGALYGGVWTLPSAKTKRRTLYALLEQVTFEALKRAQLVPNFETRISLAKKRGLSSNINPNVTGTSQKNFSQLNERRSLSSRKEDLYHPSPQQQQQQQQQMSANAVSKASEQQKPNRSHSTLSKLMFNKMSVNSNASSVSPRSSTTGKSVGLLPLKITRDMGVEGGGGASTPNSPSSAFFQNSQRPNATPVTITNPFAKFSNFVNAYIVLQEFCKELAAVILVRHASNYNDVSFVRYQGQREMMILDSVMQTNQAGPWMMSNNDELFIDEEVEDIDEFTRRKNLEKWKNRISVVSTMTTDWRSVKSLDTFDEVITARIPFQRKSDAAINKD